MNELIDNYNRRIDYLRISVTDKCNLRCKYCMSEEGVEHKPHSEILTYEEIIRFSRVAVKNGISKIRLTGGEPLIRKNILYFINQLSKIKGLDDISLTTNGILLAEMAEDLLKAGLRRVNVSLDTLDRAKFRQLTGSDDIDKVLKGIEKALEVGLEPVKINVVAMKGFNDDPVEFIDLIYKYPVHIRFIELMEVNNCYSDDIRFVSEEEIRNIFKRFGELEEAESPYGAGPAVYYKLKGAKGTIGFICPESRHLCKKCNRLRLTADGFLRVCLFSENMIDVKSVLRSKDYSDKKLDQLIKDALNQKPKDRYTIEDQYKKRSMWQIGG